LKQKPLEFGCRAMRSSRRSLHRVSSSFHDRVRLHESSAPADGQERTDAPGRKTIATSGPPRMSKTAIAMTAVHRPFRINTTFAIVISYFTA
jgi:hypothetical protein